jgi:hypothetical protein
MENIQDGIKNVFKKKEEQTKRNIENLEKLTPFFSEFEIKIADYELIATIPPISKEKEFIEDLNKLNAYELARKWYKLLFGFDETIIDELPVSAIVILRRAYIKGYQNLLKDKSFLSKLGIEQ